MRKIKLIQKWQIYTFLGICIGFGSLFIWQKWEIAKAAPFSSVKAKATVLTKAGLVGWWTMDANDKNGTSYYDKSGNSRTATSTGAFTPTVGKLKEAVIGGTGKYLDVATGPLTNLTIGLPVYLSSAAIAGGYQGIIGTATTAVNRTGYFITYLGNSGSPANKFEFGYYKNSGASSILIDSDSTYTTPGWYYLEMTYDGTTLVGRINGVKQSSTPTGVAVNNSNNLKIGRWYIDTDNYYFLGSIDDVKIYNYALSDQESANLYNSLARNNAPAPTKTGLAAWWTMDVNDKSGINFYDKSGNGNTATSTNNPSLGAGKIKEAVVLDGVSTAKRLTAKTINTTSGVTVSAWAKSSVFSSLTMWLVQKAPVNGEWGMLFFSGNLIWRGGGTTSDLTCAAPPNNTWHHFTGSQTGTTATLYIDGVRCNTGNATAAANGIKQIDIGAQTSNTGVAANFFNGSIDDVRIYNRVLTAQEVMDLYQATAKDYIN